MPINWTLKSVFAFALISLTVAADELKEAEFKAGYDALYTDEVRTVAFEVVSLEQQKKTPVSLSESYKFVFPDSGPAITKCIGNQQYIQEDGGLGKKGKILKHQFLGRGQSTTMKHLFFRNQFPGMTENICPKFNSFTDDEKLNFWIWWVASIAFKESTCGEWDHNPNDPNGTSVGELGLPASWDLRKRRGLRGGAGGCDAKNEAVYPVKPAEGGSRPWRMADLENNLICGVEILAGKLCGFYVEPEPGRQCNKHTLRPYGHGMWADLKDNGDWNSSLNGVTVEEIRRFPLCR